MFGWIALSLVVSGFALNHPKKYSEYFGWCSYHYFRLPKNEVEDIFKAKNLNYLIKYALKKL